MFKQPPIPERFSSLLPQDRWKKIEENRQRHVSHTSTMSTQSIASTTVSDFLEQKIESCNLNMEYLKSYRDGLHDAYPFCKDEFNKELSGIVKKLEPLSNEIRVLKRQRKLIILEDLQDEIKKEIPRRSQKSTF